MVGEPDIDYISFDLGGVVYMPGTPDDFFAYIEGVKRIPAEDVTAAFMAGRDDWDTRIITAKQFWERFNKALDTNIPEDDLEDVLYMTSAMDTDLVERIQLLREQGVVVGALTNIPREWLDFLEEHDQLSKLFDEIVASCYVGVRKPNSLMYNELSTVAATHHQRIVHIDNQADEAEGARLAGMRGIHYLNLEQLQEELGKLGVDF